MTATTVTSITYISLNGSIEKQGVNRKRQRGGEKGERRYIERGEREIERERESLSDEFIYGNKKHYVK